MMDNASMKKRLNELEAENNSLRSEKESLEEVKISLEHLYSQKNRENDDLKSRITSLLSKTDDLLEELSKLREKQPESPLKGNKKKRQSIDDIKFEMKILAIPDQKNQLASYSNFSSCRSIEENYAAKFLVESDFGIIWNYSIEYICINNTNTSLFFGTNDGHI